MEKPKQLALIVARRQKRLQYWRQRLAGETTPEIKEKLSTYALLLSKLAKSAGGEHLDEAEGRLQGLDRDLARLFEERRLMTSSSGVPVTGGYPER